VGHLPLDVASRSFSLSTRAQEIAGAAGNGGPKADEAGYYEQPVLVPQSRQV